MENERTITENLIRSLIEKEYIQYDLEVSQEDENGDITITSKFMRNSIGRIIIECSKYKL